MNHFRLWASKIRLFLPERSVFNLLLSILVTALILVIADRAAGLVEGWQLRIQSIWSLFAGAILFLSTAMMVFLVLTLISIGLTVLTKRRFLGTIVVAALLGSFFVPIFHWLGGALTAGEWISHQAYAPLLRIGPTVAGPTAVALMAWIHLWPSPSETLKRLISIGFLLFGFGCTVVLLILPFRAYPALKVVLFIMAALSWWVAVYRILDALKRFFSVRKIRPILVSYILILGLSAYTLYTLPRNIRSEVATNSPMMAEVFRKLKIAGSERLLYEALQHLKMDGADTTHSTLPRGLIKGGDNWNVILIVVDGLRADALEPNRPRKGKFFIKPKDTPFLNKWLKNTYHFKHAYAQGSRTHRSMPALFRSLQPHEEVDRIGVPLGTYMRSIGRTPVASVNTLFTQPFRTIFQTLLIGFEQITHVPDAEMDRQLAKYLASLDDGVERPIFSWIHLYNLHAPGFDGRILGRADGSKKKRYRRSLQYVDGQVELLIGELKKRHINETNTVFILAADHGENLGDNKVGSHGFTVYEEAIKVPLAFKIPGQKGRLITKTVGNIDVLPTITDLLNKPRVPWHRGNSLVPLMVDKNRKWEHDYYTKNAVGEMVSLVRGRDKIIHDVEADALYRYNLEIDPKENHNLFDIQGGIDQQLLIGLMRFNPKNFRSELDNKETRKLLVQRLQEADPDRLNNAIEFLIAFAAYDKTGECSQPLFALFKKTRSDEVRLAILKHGWAGHRRKFGKALVAYLKQIKNTPKEQRFVGRLALQNQPPFSYRFVAGRLKWWVEHRSIKTWRPWLRLLKNWTHKRVGILRPTFEQMLEQLGQSPVDEETLLLVLETIGNLRPETRVTAYDRLRELMMPHLDHPNSEVVCATINAFGTVGNRDSANLLKKRFKKSGQSLGVKQAILSSIVDIEKEAAISTLTEFGKEVSLQMDVLRLIQKLKSKKGLPFLRSIAKSHPRPIYRKVARNVIKYLKKHGR